MGSGCARQNKGLPKDIQAQSLKPVNIALHGKGSLQHDYIKDFERRLSWIIQMGTV